MKLWFQRLGVPTKADRNLLNLLLLILLLVLLLLVSVLMMLETGLRVFWSRGLVLSIPSP